MPIADPKRLKRIRVIGLGTLAFLIMLTYDISRPATESLFLATQTSSRLPVVWLLVSLGIIVVVAIYNLFVHRFGLLRLLGMTATISAAILGLILLGRHPSFNYLLYAWKDIYIVVLLEIFYSYADSVFPIRTARWVYSLFGMLSSLGGMTGSLVITLTTMWTDSASALWIVPLLLGLIWALCIPFHRLAGVRAPNQPRKTDVLRGIHVVRHSSYLLLLLGLIAIVQVVITLIDFEFNGVVEQAFHHTDQRTGVIATVYGSIEAATLGLHALTGPILRLVGAPLTLTVIPFIVGGCFVLFIADKRFYSMALVKVASKCLDYTLFRAAKELLYIPLSFEEKTRGKSIIDMATYRLAKGGTSLLLLGLVTIEARFLVAPLTLVLVAVWLVLVLVLSRRFRATVTRQQELTAL